jgi:hypothetical protein
MALVRLAEAVKNFKDDLETAKSSSFTPLVPTPLYIYETEFDLEPDGSFSFYSCVAYPVGRFSDG